MARKSKSRGRSKGSRSRSRSKGSSRKSSKSRKGSRSRSRKRSIPKRRLSLTCSHTKVPFKHKNGKYTLDGKSISKEKLLKKCEQEGMKRQRAMSSGRIKMVKVRNGLRPAFGEIYAKGTKYEQVFKKSSRGGGHGNWALTPKAAALRRSKSRGRSRSKGSRSRSKSKKRKSRSKSKKRKSKSKSKKRKSRGRSRSKGSKSRRRSKKRTSSNRRLTSTLSTITLCRQSPISNARFSRSKKGGRTVWRFDGKVISEKKLRAKCQREIRKRNRKRSSSRW